MASKSCRYVKPILSTNCCEARRRVLSLYKACYRYIPFIVKHYDIPKNEEQCRSKLRERFYKNSCVTDVRIIDMLIIKGYMELSEIANTWQQNHHVMKLWNPTVEPKSKSFIEKFLTSSD